MKKTLIKGIIISLSALLLAGCSPETKEETQSEEPSNPREYTLADHSIPVAIDDLEILVGQTKLQALLDQELPVQIAEFTEKGSLRDREVDPEEPLEANTSFDNAFFWITDAAYIHLTLEAGEQEIPIKDALITRLELHLSHKAEKLPGNVKINGIPVTDISFDQAGEQFPDFKDKDLTLKQLGADYSCTLKFSSKTQKLYKFSLLEADETDIEDEYNYYMEEPWQRIWSDEEE